MKCFYFKRLEIFYDDEESLKERLKCSKLRRYVHTKVTYFKIGNTVQML